LKKRESAHAAELSALLGSGTVLKGDISFEGMLRIEGKFEGSISGGALIVGEAADVNAEIEVETISVSGRLRGNVHCTDRAQLLSTAHVQSVLDTAVLVVEEGAIFEGECSMKTAIGPHEVVSDKMKIISSSK